MGTGHGSPLLRLFPDARKDLDKAEQEEAQKELEKLAKECPKNGQAKDEKNGQGEGNGNGNGGENGNGDKPPEHLRDHGFLVEEATNQEKGVVQHIFNWINLWDNLPGGKTREFTWAYIMELPLGSQKHQFSFITQFQTVFEKADNGPAVQVGDIGDTFLNYRYQLLANDDFLWCSPRFSLILPTGDERLGIGTGELGYQFNLPVSRYGDKFDFHFNAGYTFIPDVTQPLPNGRSSPARDLNGYNLGASVFWKPTYDLNFFVEALWLWNEEIDDIGFANGLHQVFVNPGFRYRITRREDVEWVVGLAAPIGLTNDTPDIGLFAYMSVEHNFRNPKKNGNGEKCCNQLPGL